MYSKPKKSLAQHFLIDKNIQEKIIQSCRLNSSDIVLEIGAGRGELTQLIAPSVKEVYSLEIDRDLCQILKDSLGNFDNVKILNQDILSFDLNKYFGKIDKRLKVIGNIPYYIATPILQHLIKYREFIEVIYLTLQEEFAKRVIASAGSKDYSSFSCFIQYYTIPRILFPIRKGCFSPRPKVDSCFVCLELRDKPPVMIKDEQLFFKIIRMTFNKRRKTLRNSLKTLISQEKLKKFFNTYGIDINVRPENLTLEDFANLANIE